MINGAGMLPMKDFNKFLVEKSEHCVTTVCIIDSDNIFDNGTNDNLFTQVFNRNSVPYISGLRSHISNDLDFAIHYGTMTAWKLTAFIQLLTSLLDLVLHKVKSDHRDFKTIYNVFGPRDKFSEQITCKPKGHVSFLGLKTDKS